MVGVLGSGWPPGEEGLWGCGWWHWWFENSGDIGGAGTVERAEGGTVRMWTWRYSGDLET